MFFESLVASLAHKDFELQARREPGSASVASRVSKGA